MAGRAPVHGHKPGGIPSPTYGSWRSMRSRCDYPGHSYYDIYGGRGISYCDEWDDFVSFLADMGIRPEGMTLDRIDPDGDYCKGNCRWATVRDQNLNTRHNVVLTIGPFTLAVTEWAELVGVNAQPIYRRVKRGWSHADAVCKPLQRKNT